MFIWSFTIRKFGRKRLFLNIHKGTFKVIQIFRDVIQMLDLGCYSTTSPSNELSRTLWIVNQLARFYFGCKTQNQANDCNHIEIEKGQVCILGRCSFLISHNVFAIYEILLNLVTLATYLKLLLQ